jgi:hypothetical protein
VATKSGFVPRFTVDVFEVEAGHEYRAKRMAWDLFMRSYEYVPAVKKALKQAGVDISDLRASDCVEL